MSPEVLLGLLGVATYLLGSVPFGLLIGRLRGVDIRQHGSRNIGATNAGRVLGKPFFWIVFALDMAKSLVPMIVASAIVAGITPGERNWVTYTLWLGVGMAALLGHVFSVYLKFSGGKGVATAAGVVLGLWPYYTLAGVVVLLLFLVVLRASRYVSLGSIAAAVVFPIAYAGITVGRGEALLGPRLPLLVLAVALATLIVWRHRENIVRLIKGTESKVGAERTPNPAEPQRNDSRPAA